MTDKTYNGWTNYATWRVNLEMFDGYDPRDSGATSIYELSQCLKELAESYVEDMTSECLARDWALAFLSDVDWYSIAEHVAEGYDLFQDEAA